MKGNIIISRTIRTLAIVACIVATIGINTAKAQPTGHERSTLQGFIGETEVRYFDSARAWPGYTLFAAAGHTYLIDMAGRVVHQWSLGTNPRLLDNGNLLDATKADPSGFGGFREVDWDGRTVWEYAERRSTYAPHHDWTRIFNRKLNAWTTLYIANRSVTREQALAAGADPADGNYNDVQVDAIVEVDMSGTIVWEWWFFDHIVQDIDASKPTYVGTGKAIADWPGKININMPGKPLKKDWLHCNSIDYSDSLGQIVINSVHGEFYVIDHDGTFVAGNPSASIAAAAGSGGDFLYRFGDPARYGQGDPPSVLPDWTSSTTGNKQIGGSHDVHWIRPGLPGAGNFLIFNNGEYLFERVSQSYIFEVDPTLDRRKVSTGAYVNPPDAGYYTWIYENRDAMKQNKFMSNQIVWIFSARNADDFFSTIGGSEQRLPNGNTLICSDTQGHLFEVTADSTPEIVWEYINPVTTDGIKSIITDHYPMYNSVFRCYRYPASHPALAGRDLSAGATITGREPDYYGPRDLHTGITSSDEGVSSARLEVIYQRAGAILFRAPANGATAEVGVFDLLGRKVAQVTMWEGSGGAATGSLDPSTIASGVYICRLTVGGIVIDSRRVVVTAPG